MFLSEESKIALGQILEQSASSLKETLSSSGAFVKENGKEAIKEIIIYEGYVKQGIGIVSSLGLIWMLYLSLSFRDVWGDHQLPLVYFVMGIVFFGLMAWFISSLLTLLKVVFAPRIFLVSYAASVLKNND